MKRSRGFAVLVLMCSNLAAAQQEPSFTLAWALEEARAANPELRALGADRTAAWERVPQVRALEDPTFSVQLWNFPFDRRPGAGSMVMLQLGQALPWPGKRALRGEVATASARIAGENVRTREYEVVAEVTRLYYQLWLNRATREINRRNQELLEQFRRAALARVPTGGAGVTDVLRSETEKARLRTELLNLERDRRVLIAALNVRLARSADVALGDPVDYFPPNPTYRYRSLLESAERQRPDLRAANLEVGRAASQTALARKSRYPDFMPSVMFMQDVEMGPAWGGMIGVTIPLWAGQKQNRAVSEAAATATAARERQRVARLEIERQVRAALAAYESAVARVQLLRDEVVPKARTALEATLAGYVTGRDSLTSVLDGRRVLQDLELEHERARAEVELARAELARAVGGRLPAERQ
ncbi:MAG: TolC family protein [Deltaproteobacteria bacterium]|nr:TolC family protein [Deltaproteobacteria bacterium]